MAQTAVVIADGVRQQLIKRVRLIIIFQIQKTSKENGMIHHDRGNRRRTDRRKRKSKYNKTQSIWGDASTYLKGILGMYDKGKIHDTENHKKTNSRLASDDCVGCGRRGNNYSHTDKRKVDRCNYGVKCYESGQDDFDTFDQATADLCP